MTERNSDATSADAEPAAATPSDAEPTEQQTAPASAADSAQRAESVGRAEPAERAKTPGRSKRATLTSIVITQLMLVLDMTIIAIALPNMQSSLGMSDVQRPWVVTAYSLAYGGLVLFGGRLCSIVGIRRSYLFGLTAFAAASFMAGVAPSFGVVVTARVLQGACAALLAPTILALISRTFTEVRERGRAFAVLGATGGVGAAVGLILGGSITDALNWRWTLYINVFIAAVALVVGRPGLPPHERERGGARITSDLAGLVLGCSGVFALVFGLDQAQRHTWSATSTVAWLCAGLALVVGFILRERLARDPVLPLSIVTSPVRLSSYGTLFMAGAAQMGMIVYITYYFQNHFEYSPMRTGLAFMPMVAAIVVTAMAAGATIVPRFGARFIFPLGLAVEAAGLLVLSRVEVDSTYRQVALIGLVVFGIGMGLCMPVTYDAGTRGVPPKRAGLASAMLNTSQQIGASFGVALLATYATQQARAYAEDNAGRFRAIVTRALMDAQAAPGSAEGERIIARYRATFADEATIEAYSGGFTLMFTILSVAALALAVGAAWYSRRQASGLDH
ncbi:MAG: MFS transporter [Actinomycetaceae bacterium]|nr:MFS transporter [Actinomycetaceae bacterium]